MTNGTLPPPVFFSGADWTSHYQTRLAEASDAREAGAILADALTSLASSPPARVRKAFARVLWSTPDGYSTSDASELPGVNDADGWRSWFATQDEQSGGTAFADRVRLELLARRGKRLPAEFLTELWERIADRSPLPDDLDSRPIAEVSRILEIAWKTALLVEPSCDLGDTRARLADEFGQLIDRALYDDNTPTPEGFAGLYELLSSAARVWQWSQESIRDDDTDTPSSPPPFDESERERLAEMLDFVIPALDREGHFAFGIDVTTARNWLPMLKSAAKRLGLPSKSDSARLVKQTRDLLTPRGKPLKLPKPKALKEPFPSWQSDAGRSALLRNTMLPGADVATVRHHDGSIRLDLQAFGLPVLGGVWEAAPESSSVPTFDWKCVCWHSDSDGDYLELQSTVTPSGVDATLRVERSLFLSRDDHFALLSDAVFWSGPEPVRWSNSLPLAAGLGVNTEANSPAWRASDMNRLLRVCPLRPGCDVEHDTDARALKLSTECRSAAWLPTLIDWNPLRQHDRVEVFPLTVTETQRTLGPEAAAGVRVRIGDQQWMFYRSLRKTPYARAVLGLHTRHEHVLARFDEDGEVRPLLLVE